jgi:hypothetical protein
MIPFPSSIFTSISSDDSLPAKSDVWVFDEGRVRMWISVESVETMFVRIVGHLRRRFSLAFPTARMEGGEGRRTFERL